MLSSISGLGEPGPKQEWPNGKEFSGYLGAFHYAKLTGQRSVGVPEENGNDILRLSGANQ